MSAVSFFWHSLNTCKHVQQAFGVSMKTADLFNNPSPEWQKAFAMADHLPNIRNKKAKHTQEGLLLRQLVKAMKGGK